MPALKEALRQARSQTKVRPAEEQLEEPSSSSKERRSVLRVVRKTLQRRRPCCGRQRRRFSRRRRSLREVKPVGSIAIGSPASSRENPTTHCTRRSWQNCVSAWQSCSERGTSCVRTSIHGLVKGRRSVSGRTRSFAPSPDLVMGDPPSGAGQSALMETMINRSDVALMTNNRFNPLGVGGS